MTTATQPSLSARMIEGLRFEGREHVLEIGIGPVRAGADRADAVRQSTDQKKNWGLPESLKYLVATAGHAPLINR